MANKIWARLVGSAVAELASFDAALTPGENIPAIWTDDVTAVVGVATGWVKATNGTFAAPPVDLPALKVLQVVDLNNACAASITGGFTSSALGAAHAYPSKASDQQNLSASIVASLLPGLPSTWTTPFWCADASGVWSFAAHTATQIQQAGIDGKAAVLACQTKLSALAAQVSAATTAEAVAAVAWA